MKKIFAMLLALLLTMTACGSKNDPVILEEDLDTMAENYVQGNLPEEFDVFGVRIVEELWREFEAQNGKEVDEFQFKWDYSEEDVFGHTIVMITYSMVVDGEEKSMMVMIR